MEFCKQAEEDANQPQTHYFEDVSTGDNSRQAIRTTLEDLISAKRIKSGNGSYQALGQMSNEGIQALFHRANPSRANIDDQGIAKGNGEITAIAIDNVHSENKANCARKQNCWLSVHKSK